MNVFVVIEALYYVVGFAVCTYAIVLFLSGLYAEWRGR